MKIKSLVVGSYGTNCYILIDEDKLQCAVIDPGGEASHIIKAIDDSKCKVKYILLTHGHIDHTGAVAEIKYKYNAPVAISEKDYKMIQQGAFVYGNIGSEVPIYIENNQVFEIGDIKLKAVNTPGHTPGGMSFLVDKVVFSGDTLFQGSIGRTDFPGGDFKTIIDSIKSKLLVLPDETVVLSGHGSETLIGEERVHNPFL
ncbi:MBL fold metallo-hydrolase [Clostridium sp. WILCCON 0269]|uniref:MBL fold metallo-hydrolase n=1 Tax=Candidatus Clostridium eludens TaxID=3381663 RepID=A0ABW8SET1_9CLOT